MSDEPKVIAEAHGYQIYSNGPSTGLADDGNCPLDVIGLAALLADAVRRLNEQIDLVAEQEANARIDEIDGLEKRIESVDNRLARLEARSHRANDRLDDLDQLGGDYTSLDGRISGLADRVAALEHEMSVAKKAEWVEISKRLSATTHDLDLWCEGNFETINRRLEALESRHQDEDPLLRVNRLVTNIVDMESRQQDEAGEEIPEHFDMPGPSRTETRHCLTDEALENLKAEVQASTASAIAERVHGGYWPSFGFISYERRIAMAEDIRREYLSGDRMKEK